jgi:hypothetical protein
VEYSNEKNVVILRSKTLYNFIFVQSLIIVPMKSSVACISIFPLCYIVPADNDNDSDQNEPSYQKLCKICLIERILGLGPLHVTLDDFSLDGEFVGQRCGQLFWRTFFAITSITIILWTSQWQLRMQAFVFFC